MTPNAASDAPTFWENLAQQFEALHDPRSMLSAAWLANVGREHVGIWILRPETDATYGARVRLTNLATKAVTALGRQPSPPPDLSQHSPLEAEFEARHGNTDLALLGIKDPWLRSWFELLREASPEFKVSGIGSVRLGDQEESTVRCVIQDVCKASANYCLELSTQATRVIAHGAVDVVRGLRGFDARSIVLRFDPNSPENTEILDATQPAPAHWQEASELGNTPKDDNETATEGAAEQRATEQTLNRSAKNKGDERRQLGGAVKGNPFENQAVVTKIRADLARIQAELLKWFAEPPAEGNLADKLVETLVSRLDAHACGWLSAVDSTPRIAEYLNRLRQVGELLIRHQRRHGFLSDAYSEDRLRQIAESSGRVLELKFAGRPEVYEAALKAEIERTRTELRSEALKDLHRRSSILSRIETRFEARYSHWEAEAIEHVQSQRGTDDSEGPASARVSSGEGPRVERVEGNSSPPPMTQKKRGRPQTIADEKKVAAAKLKAAGGTNKQAAAVLYDTNHPSDQQKKNVPAILRHHRQKSKQRPRKASPIPINIRG